MNDVPVSVYKSRCQRHLLLSFFCPVVTWADQQHLQPSFTLLHSWKSGVHFKYTDSSGREPCGSSEPINSKDFGCSNHIWSSKTKYMIGHSSPPSRGWIEGFKGSLLIRWNLVELSLLFLCYLCIKSNSTSPPLHWSVLFSALFCDKTTRNLPGTLWSLMWA